MLRDFFTRERTTPIDQQIDAVLLAMQQAGVDSDEYSKLMAYLERLNIVKTQTRRAPVSRDTMAVVIGNLFGILIIVAYERNHVMLSKGFSHIIRPKELR